jgi:peptide/nickel transport system substrate-binding protein
MEFRILGPLEVWDEGGEISLGGHKPRALLAVLLLHPNEVISADRLIDELWGEDPPERAAAQLRVNVSRLRKALPQDVLTTKAPGYVVRVGADQLDLHRFERLVNEGRTLLARGLAADASERLRDALSLWRGPALADFAYESFAQVAIARLEQIRLAAVELRIDADLVLGRHDELVEELKVLVAEQPLRERLRGCLMTALYRSGRQAEALDVYQDARRALSDELGIDPGPSLQELESAILRQDPELDVKPTAAAAVREVAERSILVAITHEAHVDALRGDDAAAKLAAKFASVAREGVERFGGEVIELRGDEALVVFASPRQAIRAAVELQTAFVEATEADPSLPLPVGIGLDAGEAIPIEGGWRGGALNLAARLCGQAGPGEVLASREVVHLARTIEGVRYVERRALHLKGMADPVHAVRVLPVGEDPATRLAPYRPSPPRPRRPVVPLRRPAIAALAVVVLASVTVAVILTRDGPSGPSGIDVNSAAAFDLRTGALIGQASLDARPGQVAAGAGALWIIHPEEGTVSRVDLSTKFVQKIVAGTEPTGVAVGKGAVWVTNSQDRTVSRINPDTNSVVKTILVGNGPTGVAVGEDAVWVANSLDDTVARIDPGSGDVQATIPVGGTPAALAVGRGAVWVAETTGGQVSRIDPGSNRVVASISVGNGPRAIAVSPDGVWVANSLDGTVSRIDPSADAVAAAVRVGAGPNGLVAVGDTVWVTNEYDGTVSRIDARTNSTAGRIEVKNAPAGAASVAGSLWVAASGAPTSHRGGMLTIGSTNPLFPETVDPQVPDPSFAVSRMWTILPLVYDTLVGYKRAGGVDGSTLVPDLAVSIPTPTNGGVRYTFKLRPGIVYSDGSPVRARDVRHSLERAFRLAPDYASSVFSGIVGAEPCAKKPASCDLSKGVVVSGEKTLSVQLTAPDPDFLHKVAVWPAVVLPYDTPDSDVGTHPLPGTGPYVIRELVPGDHLTLVRNPRFREWSRAAQPDGFPDGFEWKLLADANTATNAVEAGDIDFFGMFGEQPPGERLDEVFTRFTRQAHSYAYLGQWAMYLNTRVPPFDDVRVRRALAYAVDRKEIQRRYPGRSVITCQAIPPNFPGYQPYCPYTVSPDAGGTWTAPDMAKARALVAASGTGGMRLTVWSVQRFAPVSEHFVNVLNDLGYRATMKVVNGDDFFAFYGFVANSKNRAQAGGFWMTSAEPSPSEFFRSFATCQSFHPNDENNGNVSEFCDRQIDRGFARAVTLRVTDPAAARRAWGDVDRRITDLAPLIPVVVPEGIEFVSKRLSNYQHNPAYGILLAQVWVT